MKLDAGNRKRVAWALKCKPDEVPETDEEIQKALQKRVASLREAKHGKPIH